jgi:predicted nucleic acid-binding protein
MRVYLDNCAFNRPFDDQSHIRIRLEAEAKLYIQGLIKDGSLELVWSYILEMENDHNPFQEKRNAIAKWKRLSINDISESSSIIKIAKEIMSHGVKSKDALHVSCAIEGKAEYFITTDDKLINKLNNFQTISVVNPITLAGYLDEHIN